MSETMLEAIIKDQGDMRAAIDMLSERMQENELRISTLLNGSQRFGVVSSANSSQVLGMKGRTAPKQPMSESRAEGSLRRTSNPSNSASFSKLTPRAGASSLQGASKRMASTVEWKYLIEDVMKNTPKEDSWTEAKPPAASATGVERCEQVLRRAFDEYRKSMPTRGAASPFTALQSVLRQVDASHSGKIDINEFVQLPKVLGFQAQPTTLKALFKRFDLDNSGLIDDAEFCHMLFKPIGDVSARAKGTLARMREVLMLRAGGFPALSAMGRQFDIIDRDSSGSIDKEEFFIMLDSFFSYYDIKFTIEEKGALFAFFDRDGAGMISYDEYIRAVRGDMNHFREGLVMKAFKTLDTSRNGVITMDEIAAKYNVYQNPDVKKGKVSVDEAFKVFMDNFDLDANGEISEKEFLEAYQWVSASIDSDDYFELMMRNAWHMSGGEGWCENTANLRVLVTFYHGGQEVIEVANDLGLDKYDNRQLIQRLREQGVQDISKVELYAGF